MKITDRYASAVHSSNLKSEERTQYSDTDVLAAMGLASIRHELAWSLARIFSGDDTAAARVVQVLAVMVRFKAAELRIRMARTQSEDIAQACLAWFRNGTCRPCGGHGKLIIKGSNTLGSQDCKVCKGRGKVPFDRQFHESWREIARWLVAEMERELPKVFVEAAKKIAPSLDL